MLKRSTGSKTIQMFGVDMQTGPAGSASLPHEAEVFFDRMSIHFKKLRVVRMVDAKSKVSIYQTYSDRLIEGSPQNSGTAVPISRDQKIPLK